MDLREIKSLFSSARKKHGNIQLVIQYTTHCNAFCPQCGMRKGSKIVRKTLNKDYVKRIIDYAASEWEIKFLSFTGGEPFIFFEEIMELARYARNQGIKYIRTGTNGFQFQETSNGKNFEKRISLIAEKILQVDLYTLWISIDSSDSYTHEQMRGFPGIIKGIEKAIKIFEKFGLYPAVNLGINRNIAGDYNQAEIINFNRERFYDRYRKGFSDFYNLVINMGFTIANTCYPMSMENGTFTYHATSVDDIVRFKPEEKAILFKALYDSVVEYRSKIRIFTPLTSLYTLMNFYEGKMPIEYPCRGGIDFFYLDARDGCIYPCGYRAEDKMGEIWDLDMKALSMKRPTCIKCDWECFRDPTELFEPWIQICNNPISSIKNVFTKEKMRIWLKDMLYFYACDFFDIKKAPNYAKMRMF